MCSLEPFKIDLKGLKQGQTQFALTLDDAYFEAIDAPEVRHGNVMLTLSVERVDDFFTLTFREKGTVAVPCDLCLDDVEVEIESEDKLAAKFGEDNSEDDDTVTVAENEGILNTSWLAYEFLALAIPIKHVHEPGMCNEAMMRALEEHTAAPRSGEEGEQAIDPRWSKLKELSKQ